MLYYNLYNNLEPFREIFNLTRLAEIIKNCIVECKNGLRMPRLFSNKTRIGILY